MILDSDEEKVLGKVNIRDAIRSLTKQPISITDHLTERATRSQTGESVIGDRLVSGRSLELRGSGCTGSAPPPDLEKFRTLKCEIFAPIEIFSSNACSEEV